ncbi:MAG: FAD-binding oxidoreductase [Alphaproteobacteria bacterium]|nr:FAD-binding oxidoreductase [Alphaproteobacteria bacterium]
MHWYEMKLSGRGQTNSGISQVCRPERTADIAKYLEQVGKNGIVASGSAGSYADQALNAGGAVMQMKRLDCIRSFDAQTGELVCEPGVTLKTITELFAPQGFMLETASASGQHTLGGAIAANIIGCNGHKRMSLAKSVNWIDVVLADGTTVRASEKENDTLFKAVVGGQGLLGIISLVSITLLKRPQENVAVEKRRIANLDELAETLKAVRKTADFCSFWIDTSAGLDALGRGILKTASFTKETLPASTFSFPKYKMILPGIVLCLASFPLFKRLRYRLTATKKTKIEAYENFLYSSDNVQVFPAKGIYQLQISFSEAEGPQALRRILTELAQTRIGACRAELVLTKEDTLSYLGAALRGYTVCFDFFRRKGIEEFLKHLIVIAGEHNGRVSVQDDALLEPRNLVLMYKNLEKFLKARDTYDPQKKFDSDFGRRLFSGEKKYEQ